MVKGKDCQTIAFSMILKERNFRQFLCRTVNNSIYLLYVFTRVPEKPARAKQFSHLVNLDNSFKSLLAN